MQVQLPLDVPQFFADLVDYAFITEEIWDLVYMSHHIEALRLPQDVPYFGIVGKSERQEDLMLNLVLFEIHEADPQGDFTDNPEYRSLMMQEESS